MQYIHSQFTQKTLQNSLKQAIFKPTLNKTTNILLTNTKACTAKKPFWKNPKLALQLLGVLALLVPTASLTQVITPSLDTLHVNAKTDESLSKIATEKTLRVGVLPEHFFSNNDHRHGFGYEVASRYSEHLGANLALTSYATAESALAALNAGEVDLVVGDLDGGDTLNAAVGCQSDFAVFGINKTSFAIHQDSIALFDHAKDYLCNPKIAEETKTIARFYQTNALDNYSVNHFQKALKERLPKYQATFKKHAKKYDQDWQLLAAISYQESHLDPNAISKTGVEGLMMLTEETAAEMGIDDRTNPIESIQGGAKYLDKLDGYFAQVDKSERLWFVLAAYNMGPNAVKNIQQKLAKQGKNPNSWTEVYAYLSKNAKTNGRYVQCMHYVTNIRTYFEAIKAKQSV